MATIKDIAKETGFSTTTISLVLSGKAQNGRVSQETRTIILDTAQAIGYRANVAARRLRANLGDTLMVSVFMALDKRAHTMMRFLLGLQGAVEKCDQPIELVIHSYKSGSLHTHEEAISLTSCAVICNANEDDLHFLHTSHISVPIVLCLRESSKFSTASINHSSIGEMAADIFARRGHKHAFVLDSTKYFAAMNQWAGRFIEVAKDYGLEITHAHENEDMISGYNAGIALCKMQPRPDCVFVISPVMALGAMRAFSENGIKIPQQLELISIGVDSAGFEAFSNVSVSTLFVPMEKLAEESLNILLMQLNGKIDTPHSVELPVTYICRESCGE